MKAVKEAIGRTKKGAYKSLHITTNVITCAVLHVYAKCQLLNKILFILHQWIATLIVLNVQNGAKGEGSNLHINEMQKY